ncbi:tyrosine recombinase XerC [Streptomyces sp. NPDC058290]|uniref:site-specific integrase n=1 Tax=Streptomyces sp. NPDC058290 TaxID=3346426 RepID=UPI0036E27527
MRTSVGRGRIYRRCGCTNTQHHQLGAHCPHLITDSQHGTWNFAVDVPTPDHHRTTVRRGGFPTQDMAEQALGRFLEGEAGGYNADPNQTVAGYLNAWLAAKALVLKPTTMARYRDYVRNDLVPAFGTLKVDQLAHRHISAFVTGQLTAGRGRTTLYRCLATLSSALGDAVRQHRLPHNPASPSVLRRPPAPERRIWTAEEAARFLVYCHRADPEMADLFEFLIGTGLRKGKPSASTGTTSTSPKASSTYAAPSPPSTTTTSSSPPRRHAPAAPGSPSHPVSPPHFNTERRQQPV